MASRPWMTGNIWGYSEAVDHPTERQEMGGNTRVMICIPRLSRRIEAQSTKSSFMRSVRGLPIASEGHKSSVPGAPLHPLDSMLLKLLL